MAFDTTVPFKLKEVQLWFASIITRPIDCNSQMMPISPTGNSMKVEASQYITPSPTLRPAQRIELYNQQYWWRLLSALHDSFPLVTRLFGYSDFNHTIGFPYLVAHPPSHWSLNALGDFLPQWLEQHYEASDKKLVYDAALLDWAYNKNFVVKQLQPLQAEGSDNDNAIQELYSTTLSLQPSIELLYFDYELFSYRQEFLKEEPEFWIDNPFPLLEKKPLWSVLYRSSDNNIYWQEVSKGEYLLLQRFKDGTSIEELCEWLEDQPEELTAEASEQLHVWLQRWISQQWLGKIS